MANPPVTSITILSSLFLVCVVSAAEMETVQLDVHRQGFVCTPSGNRFVPWGHNYASVDILHRLRTDADRVERDFREMKRWGTTVVRVHPEMPLIMAGPDKVNADAIDQLQQLLRIAEASGIYLKLTGLACYRIDDRMDWYDSMPEADRWTTQAFFWETIARACADSPAIFAYDLVNEPAATGQPSDGWYMGRMGDVEFCQRLSLRSNGQHVMRDWCRRMVDSIRKHDSKHLITMGMLPFPNAYRETAELLDFVSPHLYPKSGKVAEELALLQKFDWGTPIVVGETFPLKCTAAEMRVFLRGSRPYAHGWFGHWPDTSPTELDPLTRRHEATIKQAIWLSWIKLFQELGPQMREVAESPNRLDEPSDR